MDNVNMGGVSQFIADRPMSITIIGALWLIFGIIGVLLGLMAVLVMGAIGGMIGGAGGGIFAAFGFLLGIVMIVLSAIEAVLGYGAFQAWPWVWPVGVIVTAIGVLLGIVNLIGGNIGALLSILVGGAILYFLFQPDAKAYFQQA